MRRAAILLAVLGGLAAASPARADTGTYEILDYRVRLTPFSDGHVEIAYRQTWRVTGGSIPWITVGVPSGQCTVLPEKNAGAARHVRVESQGGWSGVRIDLDRAYGANETFEVGFAVSQRGLFYADANDYRLDFTPGWYDRARTQGLVIEVFFFAKADTVSARPEPTRREGQSLLWEKQDLGAGERFPISVAFPRNLFASNVSLAAKPSAGMDVSCFVPLLVVMVVLGLIVYLFVRASVGWGYGRGGGIFYGGTRGSLGGGGRGGGGLGGIFSGGGGGFGGRAASCACACVSCACACACAGGGAAGCDRKLRHTCPLCKQCAATDCALHPGATP